MVVMESIVQVGDGVIYKKQVNAWSTYEKHLTKWLTLMQKFTRCLHLTKVIHILKMVMGHSSNLNQL